MEAVTPEVKTQPRLMALLQIVHPSCTPTSHLGVAKRSVCTQCAPGRSQHAIPLSFRNEKVRGSNPLSSTGTKCGLARPDEQHVLRSSAGHSAQAERRAPRPFSRSKPARSAAVPRCGRSSHGTPTPRRPRSRLRRAAEVQKQTVRVSPYRCQHLGVHRVVHLDRRGDVGGDRR
jgi:hypothetical protein